MMTHGTLSERPSTIISTQAFQEFSNKESSPRSSQDGPVDTQELGTDLFDSIIPSTQHVQHLVSGGGPAAFEWHSSSPAERNHLEQTSQSSPGFISSMTSAREDKESSFGALQPMARPLRSHPGDLSETSAPSPERLSARSSSKSRAHVPSRRSSRARREGYGNGSDFGCSEVPENDALQCVASDEFASTQHALQTADTTMPGHSQRSRKASILTDRSATPPPIGRNRRRAENEPVAETSQDVRPSTPETANFLDVTQNLLSVSRRHSQASFGSHRSKRSSHKPAHDLDSTHRDHITAGVESNLLVPGTRSGSGYRPRQDSMRTSEAGHDEFKSLRRRDDRSTQGDANKAARYSSFTTSIASRRPTSVANRLPSHDAFPLPGRFPSDRHSIISHSSSTRLPDFFSYEIFQIALRNPVTAHQLHRFSEARTCGENTEFLFQVEEYHKVLGNLATVLSSMRKSFMSSQSTYQLDVPEDVLDSANRDIKSLARKTFPGMGKLFTDVQTRVEELVFSDVYPGFVRHQLALSATQALANDRHRYAGLGDCFCLTNPNKADNPIVAASDGFVKVTGYTRPEIIPRNCRFLQGPQTDRAPVRRLRQDIAQCRESVELILNYKKNGEPFWNLLYVAPLFDENGELAFFIGGQVNCSTTIHSNADIMKVLSLSSLSEPEDEGAPSQVPPKQTALPSARKALLKAFGVRINAPKTPESSPSLEQSVLVRMEGRGIDAQVKEFYTAYSKYIVVTADTLVISYYSEGVLEALNPANNTGLLVGQEIFRFFKQNMISKEGDYRSKVRNAVRSGSPVSIELRLQTRRSARFRGDEVFATHWTPLKDENAAVRWVVITLASMII